jgi:hypothetical protein
LTLGSWCGRHARPAFAMATARGEAATRERTNHGSQGGLRKRCDTFRLAATAGASPFGATAGIAVGRGTRCGGCRGVSRGQQHPHDRHQGGPGQSGTVLENDHAGAAPRLPSLSLQENYTAAGSGGNRKRNRKPIATPGSGPPHPAFRHVAGSKVQACDCCGGLEAPSRMRDSPSLGERDGPKSV